MKSFIFGVFFIILSVSAQAQERTFSFTQGGFDEGATASGTFSGFDNNGNGQLSSFDGEITDFEMSFSGNSTVEAFSLDFNALYGLVYDLDGGPLGDGLTLSIEGVGAENSTYAYTAGPGPVAECGIGVDCAFVSANEETDSSQELIQVSEVSAAPVPLSIEMLVILALLLGSIGFRHVRARS